MSMAAAANRNRRPEDRKKMPQKVNRQRGPFRPAVNLAETWPEVFEKKMMTRKPNNKWDRGPDEEEVVIFIDPRPDLGNSDESYWWGWLLADAWAASRELALILHGFRCMGTRLLIRDDSSFILRPEVSNTGWQNQEEYNQAKEKHLVPYRDQLTKLLKNLSH